LVILTNATLARSNSALTDDGDYTETCWSCFKVNFNVNFKIVFKTVQLCISWWINFDSIKMCGTYVKIKKCHYYNTKWKGSRVFWNSNRTYLRYFSKDFMNQGTVSTEQALQWYLLTYLLTYSMEQSPSWEANSKLCN
jgi:hypothetical protein